MVVRDVEFLFVVIALLVKVCYFSDLLMLFLGWMCG